jgi:hypothetical protein
MQLKKEFDNYFSFYISTIIENQILYNYIVKLHN